MCMLLKNIMGFLLGIPFVWIGYDHFLRPEIFDPIVPSYLGFPRFWTLFSGLLEILLGIGIMIPFSRRMAARILALVLLFVYLANLNMWLNDVPFMAHHLRCISILDVSALPPWPRLRKLRVEIRPKPSPTLIQALLRYD